MTLRIALNELLPAKTAARELPQALDRLERREVEQLVITRRNEPRAVLVSVERYEELLLIEGTSGNGGGVRVPATGGESHLARSTPSGHG